MSETNPSKIIRFETNIPQEVTLRFSDGKEVEGRFGVQYLYSLDGDQVMYVAPAVAQKINMLSLGKGDRVEICKREVKEGRRKGIEWEVKRVDPPPKDPPPPAGTPTARFQETLQQTLAAPVQAAPLQKDNVCLASKSMAAAMIAAIDALILARDYAKSKGIEAQLILDFNGEDVRTMANAALITARQEAESSLRMRNDVARSGYVNGAAA